MGIDIEGNDGAIIGRKAVAAVVPALLPNEQEPWGLWSLAVEDPNLGLERVNGRQSTFSGTPGNVRCPSLMPGRSALHQCFGAGPYDANDNSTMNGTFTFCGLAYLPERSSATRKCLLANDGTRYISMASGGGQWCFQNYGGTLHQSTLYVPDDVLGKWFFWSVRRSADRTAVRYQLDETFVDLAVTPGNPVYRRINWGQTLSFSGEQWPGGISNVGFWTKQLSDGDLLRFRMIAMGLP